jgi:hypothetical protein
MSKWGLIGLAWGDVMASLSVAKSKNIKNIIYIGPYPEIASFIEHQDFIDKCEYRNYSFKNRYDFMKYFTRMANQFDIQDQLIYIHREFNLKTICPLEALVSCQCDWTSTVHALEIPYDLKIREEPRIEALKFIEEINHPYILIQSQSLHTNKENSHWPYWNEFVDYVIKNNKNNKIVLVGEFSDESLNKENIVDLRGKTSSVEVLFELAEHSEMTITVPNSLFHWCNIKNLNAINLCHDSFHQINPFYRYMNSLKCKHVFHKESLERAIEIYEKNEDIDISQLGCGEWIPKNSFLKQYDLKAKISDVQIGAVDFALKYFKNYDWYFNDDFPMHFIWNGLKYIPENKQNIYSSLFMLNEVKNIINFCNEKYVLCNRNLNIENDFVMFSKYGNLSKHLKSLPYIKNLVLINFTGNKEDINKTLEEHFIELPGSTEKVKLYINIDCHHKIP